jgi:hypothetical protein
MIYKMNFSKHSLTLVFLISMVLTWTNGWAQPDIQNGKRNSPFSQPNDIRRGDNGIRIMFYNVENLFDIVNDSLTADDEYAAGGMRGWSYSRLIRKINNLSKAVIKVGGWEAPEIIGLCEVENRYVLTNLAMDSPLKNFGYKIIHRDSPDPRGIDVALLYRSEKFKPISTQYIGIHFPFDPNARTRDILFVQGVVLNRDTVNIFVNHWPSRFGGYQATIPKRKYVASVLRKCIDSLMAVNPSAKIIVMGDLNDEPTDESVKDVLKAKMDSTNLAANDLYNMMTGAGCNWNRGTIKDKELWITIDQFIVSSSLLDPVNGIHTTPHSIHIMDAPFLLQKDEAWFGQKPFRTYYGARYIGGFSDHLPIYMDLNYQ